MDRGAGRLPRRRPFTVGLALGGGAARGLAHVGVLRSLESARIPIDLIVGTSAGALVGGAFAHHGSARAVEDSFVTYATGERFRRSTFGIFRSGAKGRLSKIAGLVKKGVILGVTAARPSVISPDTLAADLAVLLPDRGIEELPLRFAAVTTDLGSAREFVLDRGPLRRAVAASCALPGVFPPVAWEGRTLIDGGSVNKVPASTTRRLGADFVIAVDIHASLDEPPAQYRGIDIVSRAHAITGHALREALLADADVVIRPEVGHIHWADFGRYAELIRAGEEAAAAATEEIVRRLFWARLRAVVMPWRRPSLPAPAAPAGVPQPSAVVVLASSTPGRSPEARGGSSELATHSRNRP